MPLDRASERAQEVARMWSAPFYETAYWYAVCDSHCDFQLFPFHFILFIDVNLSLYKFSASFLHVLQMGNFLAIYFRVKRQRVSIRVLIASFHPCRLRYCTISFYNLFPIHKRRSLACHCYAPWDMIKSICAENGFVEEFHQFLQWLLSRKNFSWIDSRIKTDLI